MSDHAIADTPIYDQLAVERGDPEIVARTADEWLIHWHLGRQRTGSARHAQAEA